jgi:hypothetical protein
VNAPDDAVSAHHPVEEQFRSLLEGLRTTLPGVQLITAFLLTVPLYDKFDDLVRAERVAYYLAFTSALTGSLLLMAPSAHQRLRADDGVARQSHHHLRIAVRLTVVGTIALLVAIGAVAYLVTSIVLNTPMAIALTAAIVVVGGWSWFYLPLVTFEQDD